MTDEVYLSYKRNSREFPSITIEIQGKVVCPFMLKVVRYSLNLSEETKVLPIVIMTDVSGFSSRSFKNTIFKKSRESFLLYTPL